MSGPKDEKRFKKTSKQAASPDGGVTHQVDIEQLEVLLDFMASHNLEEFEYEQGGLRIRLRKNAPVPRVPRPSAVRDVAPVPVEPQPVPVASVPVSAPPVAPAAPPAEELHIVKSPIVGTFYASPSPEAPVFVKVGEEVELGQVVCIVEAMKLMNEIEADAKGELVRVLAENGQPVEYGQPLFAIRQSGKKK